MCLYLLEHPLHFSLIKAKFSHLGNHVRVNLRNGPTRGNFTVVKEEEECVKKEEKKRKEEVNERPRTLLGVLNIRPAPKDAEALVKERHGHGGQRSALK